MAEINMIFGGSILIIFRTQVKKLQREISLAQHIEPGRWMKWSDDYITFKPEDHPVAELSKKNLPLIAKIPIGRHKVAKTLIDSGASLNLIMRMTFIEMGLNLSDLTLIHDTFHGVIPGQPSTFGCILRNRGKQVSGDTDIRGGQFQHQVQLYLRRTFLLKFMAVIHTAYATVKMPGPRGVITLKSDQCDALACESASLTHVGRFGKEEAQKLAMKVAKMHEGETPAKAVMPGPSAGDTSKMPVAKQKQGMTVTPTPTQCTTDQLVTNEEKGAMDKEIQVDPTDADKKLHISVELEAK
jgi:hypothetical protein